MTRNTIKSNSFCRRAFNKDSFVIETISIKSLTANLQHPTQKGNEKGDTIGDEKKGIGTNLGGRSERLGGGNGKWKT